MEKMPKPSGKASKIKNIALATALSMASVEGATSQNSAPNTDHQIEYASTARVPEHAYVLTPEDFEKKTEINLINYFETDKADISEANKAKIIAEFSKFLESINPHNLPQVLASKYVIYGSSDERPTNAWEGGNKTLTEARIHTAKTILEEELAHYNFSSSDLSADDIVKIKNLDLDISIAEFPGAEKGVTPLMALINQNTGKPYMRDEIASVNEETRATLLQMARKISLHLEVVDRSKFTEKKSETKLTDEEEIYKEFIRTIADYDRAIFLSDNSPSMRNSLGYLAKTLEEFKDVLPKDVAVATFSDRLDEVHWNSAPEVLLKKLTTTGAGYEHTAKSLLAALAEIENRNHAENVNKDLLPSNVILIATDEKLQDFSSKQLNELKIKAKETNTTIYFTLISDSNRKGMTVSLKVVEESFYQALAKKIEPLQREIAQLEEAKSVAHPGDKRKLDEHIDKVKKIIESMKTTYVIPVSAFKVSETEVLNMPSS